MAIDTAIKIYREAKSPEEAVSKLRNLTTRQKAPPPPKGGIGIRAAGKRYKIAFTTIARWVKEGYIPILLRTQNTVYIDEAKAAEIIRKFKSLHGNGRVTIKKVLSN